MSLEKPLAGSNPMLHFQIRTPSTGVRPPTTLFHGLLEKEVKFAHFHQRKEIENYLLEPKVLERAARKAVEERARRTGAVVTVDFDIVGMLEAITTTLKSECSGQYVGKYSAYVKAGGKDPATLATEALTIFEKKWSALESRLEIVPGKDVLTKVCSGPITGEP